MVNILSIANLSKQYMKNICITIRKVNEAYTSQTCPVCDRKKKVSGRVYRCYCGYSEHRDIHGAKNILTKEKHGEFRDFVVNEIKYLRIA